MNCHQVGRRWFATPHTASSRGPNGRKRSSGRNCRRRSGMGHVTRKLVFGIILPVQIDGEGLYVLVRSPGQHALSRLVAANELPPGWQAVVCDAAHRIIARSEREEAFVGTELPPSQWHD